MAVPFGKALTRSMKTKTFAYVLLAPATLALLTVGAFPITYQFYISFTDLSLASPWGSSWTGLENYRYLIEDPRFLNSVWVLIRFWLGGLGLTMILGTGLALLAFRVPIARRLMPILILPMVATPIVIANFFQYLYSEQYGLIRYLLEPIGLYPGFNPTARADTVIWSLIAVDVWQWTPFVMLIVWGGLSSISTEMLESARVDGASSWQTTWLILLPLLVGEIGTAAIFRTVEGLRSFVIIWGLTRGGPGTASEATSIYIYNTAFRSLELGYAAAVGSALLLLTVAVCLILMRAVSRLSRAW